MSQAGAPAPAVSARPATSAKPLVSVVIVTWNVRALVARAVASVHAQHDADEVEVVVVDNGSIDGTADELRRRWPGLTLVELPENVGFGAANNIGFRHARGELLLLLNSDAECRDGAIEAMVAEFRRDPTVACVGARHVDEDGSLQPSMNNFPTLTNDALELTELARLGPVRRWLRPRFPWFSDHDRRTEPGWVNGACMMLRRAALDEVGPFDEAFFIYVEEVDLCYRLWRSGWKTVFTPAAEVLHLEGRSLDAFVGLRLQLRFWGHCRFYRKHYARWRARTFAALVSATAAVRLALLCTLAAGHAAGVRVPPGWRAAVAQDGGAAPYATLIGAWWRILLHRPADPTPLRRFGHET